MPKVYCDSEWIEIGSKIDVDIFTKYAFVLDFLFLTHFFFFLTLFIGLWKLQSFFVGSKWEFNGFIQPTHDSGSFIVQGSFFFLLLFSLLLSSFFSLYQGYRWYEVKALLSCLHGFLSNSFCDAVLAEPDYHFILHIHIKCVP